MITDRNCIAKWGIPENTVAWQGGKFVVWNVPADILAAMPKLPKRVFCNVLTAVPLEKALRNLINRGLAAELKTWNGCFFIRKQTGSQTRISLHSWGIAVDVNANENPIGATPKLSAAFVKCFTDAGFDWGGTWKRPDGMHFQLAKI